MHETIKVSNKTNEYIIRAEVEFLHEGHDAQHNEHAIEPQPHARLVAILPIDIKAPILL